MTHPLSQDELDRVRAGIEEATHEGVYLYPHHVSRLLDEVERLRADNNRLNTIVGGIEVENPDAVNTMIDAMKVQGAELASLRSMLGRATEALNHYADEANWGNGGWEGHPNDFFNPSRLKADRAWVVAKQVLREIRGVSGEQTSYRA